MQMSFDVTGMHVLIAGNPVESRRVVRRWNAAGAVVRCVDSPSAFSPRLLRGVSLAVIVGNQANDDGAWAPLTASCRNLGIPVSVEEPAAPGGQVTLVGGGPGVEDLLTVRALDALREADVVLFDRLAPYRNLAALAPGAELIDVGKTPGNHPVSQADIEKLLVLKAQQGLNVVRLKGGDPFVFGRGGEEVASCLAADIPVSTVPGISSSIAVPAAAGIPVTQRGVAHAFTVVSGHAPLTERELESLAGLGGTIVVLMGVGTLPHLTSGLRRAGLASTVPVAIVEKGYSPEQRTTISTLGGAVTAAGLARCTSPAVVVIGDVVRQHQGCDEALEQALRHPLVAS